MLVFSAGFGLLLTAVALAALFVVTVGPAGLVVTVVPSVMSVLLGLGVVELSLPAGEAVLPGSPVETAGLPAFGEVAAMLVFTNTEGLFCPDPMALFRVPGLS